MIWFTASSQNQLSGELTSSWFVLGQLVCLPVSREELGPPQGPCCLTTLSGERSFGRLSVSSWDVVAQISFPGGGQGKLRGKAWLRTVF